MFLEGFRLFQKHFGVFVVFWNLFRLLGSIWKGCGELHWRFWTAFKIFENLWRVLQTYGSF